MAQQQDLGYNPPCFFWIAHYNDETSLPQYDPRTGEENSFKDIDQSKLKSFGWYPFTAALAKRIPQKVVVNPFLHPVILHLEGERRLIAVRRNFVHFGFRSGIKKRETLYLLGYQETIAGRNHKTILFIDEQGNVVVSSDFNFR